MKKILLIFFFIVLLGYDLSYCEGYIDSKGIYFSNEDELFEFRNSLSLKNKILVNDKLTFYLGCQIDGIVSNKKENSKILVKADDTYFDFWFSKTQIKIGYYKLFWGKLDYLPPTDIVNPLDISKLFLEDSRKKAKISIPLFVLSHYFREGTYFDFILVPFFEEGVYDELGQERSAFNIINFPLPVDKDLPSKNMKNIEYGGRFYNTFSGIDWDLYYFRGFEDFPSYRLDAGFTKIKAEYNKSNMFGGDFEFVKGNLGIRGEGALFINDNFQKTDVIDYVKERSFLGGVDIDRSFQNYYTNFGLLYKKIFSNEEIEEEKEEMSLMANVEKKFSYDTKIIKLSVMYNIMSNSMFLKQGFSINLIENLWVDLSVGLFEGEKNDILSKYRDNDFILVKCQYDF